MTKKYRLGLPEMPENIQRLPVDPDRGYPVPFFVRWIGGKPEFRFADPHKITACIKKTLCWICGYPLPKKAPGTFVGGPLMSFSMTSAEPPSHTDCARFACKACPFLVMPQMVRRVGNIPEDAPPVHDAPGVMVKRNPGVAICWTSMWLPVQQQGGYMFRLSEPLSFEIFREGREATPEELRFHFEESYAVAHKTMVDNGGTIMVMSDWAMKKKLALKRYGLIP